MVNDYRIIKNFIFSFEVTSKMKYFYLDKGLLSKQKSNKRNKQDKRYNLLKGITERT